MHPRKLAILGCRGIPAKHGGFETFAERLSLFLVNKGWKVIVYCQDYGKEPVWEEDWQGIRLVHIPVSRDDALGTIFFDWKASIHALRHPKVILTLGYGTALFSLLYRLKGYPNFINMDGLEWQRAKWGFFAKLWLWINERSGCRLANGLIADHPEIQKHLTHICSQKKIAMIPYGSDAILSADIRLLEAYELKENEYALVIARPEPENSLLEIISAYSSRKRGLKLIVLGKYQPGENSYHRKVMDAASTEVLFLGPIYNQSVVMALRYHARLYIHGHQVGGTNPSLVEALGAGLPILAHDNKFNRWVAGDAMAYFKNTLECSRRLDMLLDDFDALAKMSAEGRQKHKECFTWEKVLAEYENLLERACEKYLVP